MTAERAATGARQGTDAAMAPGAPLFVGIDLAWKASARTGLAAVGGSGCLLVSGSAVTDDEITAWISALGGVVATVAVDAPLVVPNPTGQRRGENEVARAYGAYLAGPYPTSRANPLFDPPRAAVLAERLGWRVDPAYVWSGPGSPPGCIEVYPHPAMVGLFGLDRRILYKKGPTRARGFADLVGHFESIEERRLAEPTRGAALRRIVGRPARGDLSRNEAEVDAILCAHLAWLWHYRRSALQVYGTLQDGYIVAPPPPAHRAARAAPGTSGSTPGPLPVQ